MMNMKLFNLRLNSTLSTGAIATNISISTANNAACRDVYITMIQALPYLVDFNANTINRIFKGRLV